MREGGSLRPVYLLLRSVVNPFVTLKNKALTLEAALHGSYVHAALKSSDELVAWRCKLHRLQLRDSKVMQTALLVCLFLRSRVLAQFLFEALTETGDLASGGDLLQHGDAQPFQRAAFSWTVAAFAGHPASQRQDAKTVHGSQRLHIPCRAWYLPRLTCYTRLRI